MWGQVIPNSKSLQKDEIKWRFSNNEIDILNDNGKFWRKSCAKIILTNITEVILSK